MGVDVKWEILKSAVFPGVFIIKKIMGTDTHFTIHVDDMVEYTSDYMAEDLFARSLEFIDGK